MIHLPPPQLVVAAMWFHVRFDETLLHDADTHKTTRITWGSDSGVTVTVIMGLEIA